MDFWSKWYCIVGSISGGNCNASQSRHWWLWRNMQWISGQNRIILLKVFLLEIALHRWQGSGGIGGKCNGFLVKMVLYCWKYFWCKLQCIPFQTLVVLEEYEMIFGQNCIVLLEVFLVEIALHRWQGILVVLKEYAMNFWSKLCCVVGSIYGINCNASHSRHWWF